MIKTPYATAEAAGFAFHRVLAFLLSKMNDPLWTELIVLDEIPQPSTASAVNQSFRTEVESESEGTSEHFINEYFGGWTNCGAKRNYWSGCEVPHGNVFQKKTCLEIVYTVFPSCPLICFCASLPVARNKMLCFYTCCPFFLS